jgi:hypothetical protein
MGTFDPDFGALVYGKLDDQLFEWKPEEFAASWHRCTKVDRDGVANWDGLLLVGWLPEKFIPDELSSTDSSIISGRSPAGEPGDEPDSFVRCPQCGQMFDVRDPGASDPPRSAGASGNDAALSAAFGV